MENDQILKHGKEWKEHKYVMKKNKNGKMRYYYNYKSNSIKDKVKDALGYDEKYDFANTMLDYNDAQKYERDHPSGTRKELEQRSKATQEAGKRAIEARDKYYKTPIGKLDKFDDVIDKGRKAVAKALNKAAKAITPKEEFLDRTSK